MDYEETQSWLRDCRTKDAALSELFVVPAGLFPGHRLAAAWNRDCQAVLTLHGAIIDAETAALEDVLDDQNIRYVMASLGVGIDAYGEGIDLRHLRYGRIVLAFDSTADNRRIRTFLLKFIYRYNLALIKEQRVFCVALESLDAMSEEEIVDSIFNPLTRRLIPVPYTDSLSETLRLVDAELA